MWRSSPVLLRTFCLFGQDVEIPLTLITLDSDYNASVKNYSDYFCQFREKLFNRNLVRKRMNKSPVHLFSGSNSRDTLWLLGVLLGRKTFVGAQEGFEHECLRIKKPFQHTHTMDHSYMKIYQLSDIESELHVCIHRQHESRALTLSVLSTVAPYQSSVSTTFLCPFIAAYISGVQPL